MSTLIISILSGLVGASIAAYFNYRIRLSLLEKSNIDSERKLAYVYVVQLSQYSAINFWITNFFEKALEQLDEPLPEEEFELTHAASIYIEDVLSNIDGDSFDKVDSIDKLIDQMMDSFNNTYLSNEQQANLPKQTILFYQRYEHYLKSTAATFKFFKACLSNKNLFDMLNAKQINSAIETVKSLFDAAGLLRAAMAEHGGISSNVSGSGGGGGSGSKSNSSTSKPNKNTKAGRREARLLAEMDKNQSGGKSKTSNRKTSDSIRSCNHRNRKSGRKCSGKIPAGSTQCNVCKKKSYAPGYKKKRQVPKRRRMRATGRKKGTVIVIHF